jgi:hypothetical protein
LCWAGYPSRSYELSAKGRFEVGAFLELFALRIVITRQSRSGVAGISKWRMPAVRAHH